MNRLLLRVAPALAALAAAACSAAAAQPAPVVGPAQARVVTPPASVQIVTRLHESAAAATPSVTGAPLREARERLAGDVHVSVVRVGPGRRVTGQWPAAGEPATTGEAVLWVGRPPVPAPAPVAAPAAPPAPQQQAAAPAPSGSFTGTAPRAPVVDSVQPGGRTPGLEGFTPPPHPPRSNIRTMPPAAAGTTLEGRASWYGPGFAGHQTACGGVFDPDRLTLATRELRCGTVVTVTGPSGSVTATVTDWGPAEWTGRRFDLSAATFAAVAPLGSGVTDVTVTVAS